jgi:hypothetical protein
MNLNFGGASAAKQNIGSEMFAKIGVTIEWLRQERGIASRTGRLDLTSAHEFFEIGARFFAVDACAKLSGS